MQPIVFFNNPPNGTLAKNRKNRDTLRYHLATNSFGIMDKNGEPGAMHKPTVGINYWNRQK